MTHGFQSSECWFHLLVEEMEKPLQPRLPIVFDGAGTDSFWATQYFIEIT